MGAGYYWFSNYPQSGWTPDNGYNTLFADQVLAIRSTFNLQKVKGERAHDQGTGSWVEFGFSDGTAKAKVNDFRYGSYYPSASGVPLINFELDFDYKVYPVNYSAGFDGNETMLIVFPSKFPKDPPDVKFTKSEKYKFVGSSHEHHILDGWLCLYRYNTDWNSKKGTVIVPINWAIEWLVMHHRNFEAKGWWRY